MPHQSNQYTPAPAPAHLNDIDVDVASARYDRPPAQNMYDTVPASYDTVPRNYDTNNYNSVPNNNAYQDPNAKLYF